MVAVTGLGSGIDIDALVANLIGAERGAKEARLNSKEADATAVLTAFGTTKTPWRGHYRRQVCEGALWRGVQEGRFATCCE